LVTRTNGAGTQGNTYTAQVSTYYYHSDHLGSAQLITDNEGREYERIEYTPYGEYWIEKRAPENKTLPFKFTGKERDEETGLYYYGARYLDPRTSRWLSADPVLADYIPLAPVNDEAKKHNQNLPGMGGIYNSINMHLYHYAGNNPVKYIDPDGESVSGKILGYGCILGAGVVVIAGAVSAAAGQPYITPGAAALAKGLFLARTAMLAVDTVADITSANSQTVPSVLGNGMSASASSPNPMPENDGDGNRNDISQSAKDAKKNRF